MWLIWPVLLWGALVVLSGGVGYLLLSAITKPVAMFNSVNYVNVSLCERLVLTRASTGSCLAGGCVAVLHSS